MYYDQPAEALLLNQYMSWVYGHVLLNKLLIAATEKPLAEATLAISQEVIIIINMMLLSRM